jgi:hypothetical protein
MFDLFFGLAFWLCATIRSSDFGSSESSVFGVGSKGSYVGIDSGIKITL